MDKTHIFFINLVIILTAFLFADECTTKIRQPSVNNFSIVIDRSGSMSGNSLSDAKKSVNGLIDELKQGDKANIIAFDSKVSLINDITNNKRELKSSVRSINSGGATHLYDAIGRASSSLRSISGSKIIIFLTDGDDTGSKFSIGDIRSMNLSEGIFVYGIGLGKVDKSSLDDLSEATNGTYFTAKSSSDLYNIYDKVIQAYYKNYGNNLSKNASMTIRSLPSGMNVSINGKNKGKTPLKLEGLNPGNTDVVVEFQRGEWNCSTRLETGYRTIIDARESDIGRDVFVSTTPPGASVFLDGNYIGDTPFGKLKPKEKRGLFQKNDVDPNFNNLLIPLVPNGKHELKVIAVPEMEMGFEYEFQFNIGKKDRSVHVDLFNSSHKFKDGEKRGKTKDPFDVFDSDIKGKSKDPFKELDDF